ncbi:Maf family protein [Psychrobacter urativorans]|uniref:Maf family protein n=1 Tax=Psychrobacter urativorans TaxID=45610 RepID=UPI00191AB82B|nr:Maf family protein [Psychrobacter urativorans]
MHILLASGSPRRRELLANAKLDLHITSVDIDESTLSNESPIDYIQRMVASKATAAVEQLNADYRANNSLFASISDPFIMLTADTIGVLPDGKTVLVKPIDRAHAYQMWQQMSANTHQVWTAVQATKISLLPSLSTDSGDQNNAESELSLQVLWQRQIIERTQVSFVPLTPAMMADYWDSGEPADKAGAYGIQGLAAAWVTAINGSYTNVVGLPLAQTLALIEEASSQY